MSLYSIERLITTQPPQILSGASLELRKLDARQRASLAAQVLRDEVVLQLSRKQVEALLRVNTAYVGIALQLSPGKRAAIAGGKDPLSFSLILNKHLLTAPVVPPHVTAVA